MVLLLTNGDDNGGDDGDDSDGDDDDGYDDGSGGDEGDNQPLCERGAMRQALARQ